MSERILISEIFGPTVQGEGPLVGRPTVFVRTGGCDYRCSWCDTLYAVLPKYRPTWTRMDASEIMAEIDRLTSGAAVLVSLSGGNPALQPLGPVVELGRSKGHSFALETQGSIARSWFAELDWLILSPKPPSSGMSTDWEALDACIAAASCGPQRALKIVVFDDEDYAWARAAAERHPELPIYLQVGNPSSASNFEVGADIAPDLKNLIGRYEWLVGKVVADRWFAPTVLPQLHVLVWGNRRGV